MRFVFDKKLGQMMPENMLKKLYPPSPSDLERTVFTWLDNNIQVAIDNSFSTRALSSEFLSQYPEFDASQREQIRNACAKWFNASQDKIKAFECVTKEDRQVSPMKTIKFAVAGADTVTSASEDTENKYGDPEDPTGAKGRARTHIDKYGTYAERDSYRDAILQAIEEEIYIDKNFAHSLGTTQEKLDAAINDMLRENLIEKRYLSSRGTRYSLVASATEQTKAAPKKYWHTFGDWEGSRCILEFKKPVDKDTAKQTAKEKGVLQENIYGYNSKKEIYVADEKMAKRNAKDSTEGGEKTKILQIALEGTGSVISPYVKPAEQPLNPKLFDSTDQLHSEVRTKLYEIVGMFLDKIKEYNIPIQVLDVFLVGSNVAYNYRPESDLDVHIIADLEMVANDVDLLQLVYTLYKGAFNGKYDIGIKGINVELYIEDVNLSCKSNGVYSLYRDEWVKFPTREADVDVSHLPEFVDLESRFIEVVSSLTLQKINDFLNDLYLNRKMSLIMEGEHGLGNLLFKEFRRKGYLDRLKELLKQKISSELSLEQLECATISEQEAESLLGKTSLPAKEKTDVSNVPEEYKSGDCYQQAWKLFYSRLREKPLLVHGIVTGQGRLSGIEYNHAWVEIGDTVYDKTISIAANGIPKETYYSLGNVKEDLVFRYTIEQVSEKAIEYMTYGPWENILENYN